MLTRLGILEFDSKAQTYAIFCIMFTCQHRNIQYTKGLVSISLSLSIEENVTLMIIMSAFDHQQLSVKTLYS